MAKKQAACNACLDALGIASPQTTDINVTPDQPIESNFPKPFVCITDKYLPMQQWTQRTTVNPETDEQLAIGRAFMREYHDTFQALAQ